MDILMKKIIFLVCLFSFNNFFYGAKIKDLVKFESYYPGDVTGYGIVVGLNGTGDRNISVTQKALSNMFLNFGINVSQEQLKTRNSASVMVHGKLEGGVYKGQKINIEVSSIGDALSIDGGLLLRTPLYDSQGNIVAFASGKIKTQKNKTSGFINNGGEIYADRMVSFSTSSINIYLKKPDYSNAVKISRAIKDNIKNAEVQTEDAVRIKVNIKQDFNYEDIVYKIGEITVEADVRAKIVINSLSGDVAITGKAEILPCSISVGDLDIEVGGDDSGGGAKSVNIKNGEVGQLIKALEYIKAKPSQVVEVIKTLDAAGLIVGDVEII